MPPKNISMCIFNNIDFENIAIYIPGHSTNKNGKTFASKNCLEHIIIKIAIVTDIIKWISVTQR
jgi:hypothetical protein